MTTPEQPTSPSNGQTLATSINPETFKAIGRNRSFLALLIGQWASFFGDQFTIIATLPVIHKLSGGNALATAAMPICLALPRIFFGLVGGVLVDRFDRKKLMLASEAIRGTLMMLLVFASRDAAYLWMFYFVALGQGFVATLFYPARSAVLPIILTRQELAIANALLNMGVVMALIFGSLMAGVTVELIGPQWAFAIDASSYYISGLTILFIVLPRRTIQPVGSAQQVWHELKEGLIYVWKTRSIRYIMALSVAIALGLGGTLILTLDYLQNQLQVGTSQFGLVIAVLGLGIILGGAILKKLSGALPTNRLVALAISVNGLALSFFVIQPPLIIVLGLAAIIGFSFVVSRAVLGTLTQAIPPDSLQGRVQGAFDLVFQSPFVLSIGLAGAMLGILPVQTVFFCYGMMLILTAYLALRLLQGIDEVVYADRTSVEL
ncbi:MAG: MFS transporter [Chloroflexi bacterium]|nr:MFS transporter [Chloroflexota bacterium]